MKAGALADVEGMRAAAYLTLTPFLLLLGWATLAGAVVKGSGLAEATSGRIFVSASSLLMIPLGIAFGWRYRHVSLRLPALLVLTPVGLLFGWFAFWILLLSSTGLSPDAEGALGAVLVLASLLMIPLGIALGWRYRQRSLRLPAHLIVTPVVLFFGWWLLAVLLIWATGQEARAYGALGTIIRDASWLMILLGIAVGWRRYQHQSAS